MPHLPQVHRFHGSHTGPDSSVADPHGSHATIPDTQDPLAQNPQTAINMGGTTGSVGGPIKGIPDASYPATTVFLKPIAHPAALGTAAWASAAFVVSAYYAEWYGTDATALTIWPFVLMFGGIGQLAAGMWSFNARDTLNSVFNTMWGAFWAALAIYYAVLSAGYNIAPANGTRYGHLQNFAIWLIPLAAITGICALAALKRDLICATGMGIKTVGAVLAVIGWFVTSTALIKIASYFWIVASVLSLYRLTGYLLHEATRKESHRLPMFYRHRADDIRTGWNVGYREPGVVQGEW